MNWPIDLQSLINRGMWGCRMEMLSDSEAPSIGMGCKMYDMGMRYEVKVKK